VNNANSAKPALFNHERHERHENRFLSYYISQNLRGPRRFQAQRKPPYLTAKSAKNTKNSFSRFSRLSRFFSFVAASLRQSLHVFRGSDFDAVGLCQAFLVF